MNGEHHPRPEKKSCRSETCISLVRFRNIAAHLLWLTWCSQVVDLCKSYEWRTSSTTREKELSIRKVHLNSGI